jgi:hypothetical protein
MEIEKLISLQNRVYVHALNRKLGYVIPADMIKRQIAGGADPHSIAQLIIKKKNELARTLEVTTGDSSSKATLATKFERFVSWLRLRYK